MRLLLKRLRPPMQLLQRNPLLSSLQRKLLLKKRRQRMRLRLSRPRNLLLSNRRRKLRQLMHRLYGPLSKPIYHQTLKEPALGSALLLCVCNCVLPRME